jgi:RimJ/RimL family protein N-acetyltransferase
MSVITGSKVALRRATLDDAQRAYEWLALSDLSAGQFGPPVFPDRTLPHPAWFAQAFPAMLFDGALPFFGRAYVICTGERDIGFLCHGPLDLSRDITEVQMWMAERAVTGQGFGTEALRLACRWIQSYAGINRVLVRPSRREVRALRAARRAGFRAIDGDGETLREQLGVAPAGISDSVFMICSLPLPAPQLLTEPGRTYAFVDSEFTSFSAPQLISLGAAASDSTAFYCEIADWHRPTASDFVHQIVVPLLDGDAVPRVQAAAALEEWLAARSERGPLTLVSDSGFDRWALAELLGEDLPPGVDWRCVPLPVLQLDTAVASLRLRRHHALDDARALRHALMRGAQAPATVG